MDENSGKFVPYFEVLSKVMWEFKKILKEMKSNIKEFAKEKCKYDY